MANILIVEDHPGIQDVYQTVLRQASHTVRLATDGKEALAAIAEQAPDLILLDLLMPNMGGLEFLRTYNAAPPPHAAIVVLSNLASPELAQEAKTLGVIKYFTKSNIAPKELLQLVEQTLTATHERPRSA